MIDALPDWSLRSALLLAVALAAVYFLVIGVRFLQLRRGAKAPAVAPPPMMEPIVRRDPPIRPAPDYRSMPDPEPPRSIPVAPPPVAPAAPLPSFDAALGAAATETRLQSLMFEVQSLRTEVAQLQADVARLEAARNVSPLYGEAVSLAQQGMDAETIAVRCGISIAEAELVTSLSGKTQDAMARGTFPEEEYS